MKKKIALLLFVMLLFSSFAACTPEATSPIPVANTPEATASVASTLPEPTPEPTLPTEGTMEEVMIPAPSLANNIIDEPTEQGIAVYLPPSYAVSDQHYPVLYYLPGFGDDYKGALRSMNSLMRGLVADGVVREMIIVSINGTNRLGGSFYANSPVTGNWEDFVVKDVVSYVDANYRTIPEAAARGLTGHSMGGYGVIGIAMHTTGVFGSAYALSPGLFDDKGLEQSLVKFSLIEKEREQLAELNDEEAREAYLAFVDALRWTDNFTFSYGSAFAPDPEGRAPYILLPEKEGDGSLHDDVWALYQGGFGGIPKELDQYADNLKSLQGFVFDAGDRDEFQFIPQGCAYFSEQLTLRDIPHEYLTFPGAHQDRLYDRLREQVFPFFSKMFATP